MLRKLRTCIKNPSRFIVTIIFLFSSFAIGVGGYIPVDDTRIKLPDGREILSVRTGPNSHKIVLKKKQKVLWEKNFEEEYDRLWDYAFFVPVKKGYYSYDLDHDGYPKIAIATWDGGNAMDHRTALIFEVKKNSLKYYGIHHFNLEYGRYVYP
jgi:hypothetical protein